MISKEALRFMKRANKEAEKALARGDYPGGCLIVKSGKIIAKASCTGVTAKNATAHAEINAIGKAGKKLGSRFLTGCTVYDNIEPCIMCAKAMVYAQIKKVVYGAAHGEYGLKKSFDILKQNNIGADMELVAGVDKETSEVLLKKFLDKKIPIYK